MKAKLVIITGRKRSLAPSIADSRRPIPAWRRSIEKDRVTITFDLFRALKRRERDAMRAEAERFGRFAGLPVRISDVET